MVGITMFFFMGARAQNKLITSVRDIRTKEPLAGTVVNIEGSDIGNAANEYGVAVLDKVPAGKQVLRFRMLGYIERTDTIMFPTPGTDTFMVFLEPDQDEMNEFVVSITRSTRTIQDIPTRVELIGGEELDEKANMKPGDIRMLLAESTGIQTQQTSATSGNSAIRIEGLDGRYTQILKNGFPVYAGMAGGLGLLQTPPLDLKRVEIVKGASSTLYGGGAIAGLINLISKTPSYERELRFLVNGTSAKGLDVNGFYSKRFGKAGITVYAAYDVAAPYTTDTVVFTAIPRFSRYTLNPRLFLYPSERTEITIGVNGNYENRMGGDIYYITGRGDSTHRYYEKNETRRVSSEIQLTHKMAGEKSLSFKNSVAYFRRTINAPGYTFDGAQNSTFTEANFSSHGDRTEWIVGANIFTDGFNELMLASVPLRNYLITTIGLFGQNTYDISKKLILETGLRGDYVLNYGPAVLPRVSLLYKHSTELSSRIGGGLGYKAPTIFTEESERIIYRNILPISPDSNKLEKSYGGNADVNYKTIFAGDKITFSFNQLFFYTRLNDPLLLEPLSTGMYRFHNVSAHIDAAGFESNMKLGYKDIKLFLGYTFTHSHIHTGSSVTETPLTPRHHTNSVLMYELDNKWKVGAEAYYYSKQRLSDGSTGRGYWLCGLMAEKIWKQLSVYINFENILDSRQTRFDTIYSGSISYPQFRDIYAPLDGFVVNGGMKLRL